MMVRTEIKTFEEGMDMMRTFVLKNNGYSYAFILERDDCLFFEGHRNRPCYGEFRRYGVKSTRPWEVRPGDLPTPLGPGTPLAAGASVGNLKYVTDVYSQVGEKEIGVLFSSEGIFRKVLPGVNFVYRDNGGIGGIIWTDMSLDSTMMVQTLRLLSFFSYAFRYFNPSDIFTFPPDVAGLLLLSGGYGDYKYIDSYYVDPSSSPQRVLKGDMQALSFGPFNEGFDYNRFAVSHVFTEFDEKTLEGLRTGGITSPYALRVSLDKAFGKTESFYKILETRLGHLALKENYLKNRKEIIDALQDWR